MPNVRGKSTSRYNLTLHNIRGDNGLCYGCCTLDELIDFCESRHIKREPPWDAIDLAGALQTADKKRAFSNFLDLPPELRMNVYEHCFQDFNADRNVAPPPITNVSTLTREESLPMAYGSHLLQVQMRSSFDGQRFVTCSHDMSKAFREMSSTKLGLVRMLQIEILHETRLPTEPTPEFSKTTYSFRVNMLRGSARYPFCITGTCDTRRSPGVEVVARNEVCNKMMPALYGELKVLALVSSGGEMWRSPWDHSELKRIALEEGDELQIREAWHQALNSVATPDRPYI